jgi:hypothetical protein
MSMSKFGSKTNGFSGGLALMDKTHTIKDPTARNKGKIKAKLAGRKEKTIQRNL